MFKWIGAALIAFALMGGGLFGSRTYFGGKAVLNEIRMAAVDHKEQVRTAMSVSAVHCLQSMTNNQSPALADKLTGLVYGDMVDANGFVGDGAFTEADIDKQKEKKLPQIMRLVEQANIIEGSPTHKRFLMAMETVKSSGAGFFDCTVKAAQGKLKAQGILPKPGT